MKLIVGLGNPGAEHAKTRHNAGFMAVDRLADRHAPGVTPRSRFSSLCVEASIPGAGKCLLLKPMTYMNLSGGSVSEAVRFYKIAIDDLLVVVDDVALPIGTLRVREEGGTGGHNGLADVEEKLGTDRYARLRVGVDAAPRGRQVGHVLGRFSEEEWELVGPALERAVDAIEMWAARGAVAAMNEYNTRAGGRAIQDPGARDEGATGSEVQRDV